MRASITHSTEEDDTWRGDGDDDESSEESSGDEENEDEEEGVDDDSEGFQRGSPSNLEVDGDFARLVQDIRESESGLSSGILGRAWNVDVEAQEEEFRNDLREASGVGRKKVKRGRRSGVALSQEVRHLIGEGNQAYVDNDTERTMRVMQEVIRIEPRAEAAWRVLAQCHQDLGNMERALLMRVMAAHLSNDPDEWGALAEQSRTLGFHQQALYCYRKLYNLDPTNTNALWDRASLAKEIGELRTAYHCLLAILKRLPHDLTVLEELRPILIELSEFPLCASLFRSAFDHYRHTFPAGVGINPDTEASIPGGGFELMELLVLGDLYNTLGEYGKAVDVIRKGCRWLQGREKEGYWDECEDDREFDGGVGEGRVGAGRVGEGLKPGAHSLDVNARHRLAIARIRLGDLEEGKLHANIVLKEDDMEYAPLFAEIADAYFDKGLYAEAGQIYESLGADTETSSIHVLMQAAACRHMIGDIREAAEVYEHVLAADPTNKDAKIKLAEMYESLGEVRKALDLVLQVIDSRKRRPGGRQDADNQETDQSRPSLFEEKSRGKGKAKPQKLSMAELRQAEDKIEKEVVQWYHRVKELWARMLEDEEEAVREWLMEAEKLVEMFRHTRPLFLTSRHQGFKGMFPRSLRKETTEASEESMAVRLQLELGRDTLSQRSHGTSSKSVDNFRTISFDDWLRLFIQYAFLMTKRDEVDYAVEVLRHVSWSNAFQNRAYQDSIRFAIITCAVHAQRYSLAVEQARKLINTHQFNNEPFRILVASLSHGLHATDAFLASTLSKHLLREIKTADVALRGGPEAVKWNAVTKRYAIGLGGSGGKAEEEEGDEDELERGLLREERAASASGSTAGQSGGTTKEGQPGDGKVKLPTKPNPVIVAVYGQVCLAAKSYQSALFYLLHAHEYCPHDPLICLCLAIASMGRAMQRQSDNRHHLITQAMAFLTKYRNLRGENAEHMVEVEYNFGRAFHQLGLLTHAVRHYERMLDIVDKKEASGERTTADLALARTAAYNSSLIYVTTGAGFKAEALYKRWLAF